MRVKLTLQYKGTNFCGWQVQPNGVTIQALLQKAVSQIFCTKINVVGSGRTDSGVHALAQVAHFDLPPNKKKFSLSKLQLGLNSLLPADISVINVGAIPCQRQALRESPLKFHAQLSAKRKIYDYYIFNSSIRSVFYNEYSWQIIHPLKVERMQKAASCLIGEHDFKCFCASDSGAKTTVRRIYKIQISEKIPNEFPLPIGERDRVRGRVIRISITGNGFLKHMVRNIVGTLVDVGRGKTKLPEVKKILKSKDRRCAGRTAPAKGLFLRKVNY